MSDLNDSILITPSDEHIKALLSKLAYENLSTSFNFSNLNDTFSIAEKNYLNANFEVLSVSNNSDYETGFQGCILRNIKTNEITYAIRGTNNSEDFDDDADIDLRGMATKQFIEAYNYFIKSTTPVGTSAYLIEYTDDKPESGAYNRRVFYLMEAYQEKMDDLENY